MKTNKPVVDNNKEKIVVEIGDKIVVLTLLPFDADVDMDEFTAIHYHNLMGEIITSSVALNRIGTMLAQYNEILVKQKLDFDIFYAHQEEKFRKELTKEIVTSRSTRNEEPSDKEINWAIMRTPEYKVKKLHLITLEKNKEIIEAFYWAVQDKCKKIQYISDKLRPEEFLKDLIEENINGVMIKVKKKAIA